MHVGRAYIVFSIAMQFGFQILRITTETKERTKLVGLKPFNQFVAEGTTIKANYFLFVIASIILCVGVKVYLVHDNHCLVISLH